MRADTQSIYGLFETSRRYVVPLYQRHYVWSQAKQWEPFWEDVLTKTMERFERNESAPHFMGAMVFTAMPTFGRQIQALTVIDGQQRLTTLQIFLAAFRDTARKYEYEFVDDIEKHILNTGRMDDKIFGERKVEEFKVFPTKVDQQQFYDVIVSGSRQQLEGKAEYTPRYERRKLKKRPPMVEAYLYFEEVLENYLNDPDIDANQSERIESLHEALRNDLMVVTIDLEPRDDPQVIFETLNASGEPLLPSDLLRNNIFRRAELKGENQDLLYQQYWKIFEEEFWRKEDKQGRLTRPRIDLFMQYFLALKKKSEVNVGHLFAEYKSWIESSGEYSSVSAELEDLVRYASAYYQLVNQDGNSLFGDFAERLNIIDVRTIYPLLLFLLADSELTEAELLDCGRILESYLIRRAVCGLTTKNYNKSFLQILRELQTTTVSVKALENLLLGFTGPAGVFPDDAEFERAWLANPVYETLGQGKVKLILRAIENGMRDDLTENVVIPPDLTVEHILPQQWQTHWALAAPAEDDSDNSTETDSVERDNALQTFGNLTLIVQKLNSSVSNGPFVQKKQKILDKSVLLLNRFLRETDIWNEKEIYKRGKDLFQIAKKIWPYPQR